MQSEERQTVVSNVFHQKLQECLQRYMMSATVHFEFNNPVVTDRDYLFRLREFVELGTTLYQAQQTTEEVRQFCAAADARFEAWTANEEPTTESSADQSLIRSLPAVQAAIAAYRRGECRDAPILDASWRRYPCGKEETHSVQRALKRHPDSLASVKG